MLDMNIIILFKIQYPETSIQYHKITFWNHVILYKLDINFKMLGY